MENFKSFMEAWNTNMAIGAIVAVALAIVAYLFHNLRVSLISDFKKKYDYLNSSEIRWYKLCFLLLGLAFALWINTYGKDKFTDFGVWFYVRIFFSIAGATLVAYIASLILDYYYPTKLNAKLRKC